jgi:hypothetical protein
MAMASLSLLFFSVFSASASPARLLFLIIFISFFSALVSLLQVSLSFLNGQAYFCLYYIFFNFSGIGITGQAYFVFILFFKIFGISVVAGQLSHLNFLLVLLWFIILMKGLYHLESLSMFFGGN